MRSTEPEVRPRDSPSTDVSVLSLVTSDHATFYRQQVEALGRLGVRTEVVPVSGTRAATGDGSERSLVDYLGLVADVRKRDLSAYDLVHANYGLTVPAAFAQRTCPVVLSLWGSDVSGRFGWIGRLGARRASETIVMSSGMAETLRSDCTVIPHGVDLELFEPMDREQALSSVGWAQAAKHVLFPYPSDRAVKNYPLARRLVDVADARLPDDVVLHTLDERVAHERMPVLMNAADAMVLVSASEGSPNTVKEAMACNLPVVARDVGDVRERLRGVEPSVVAEEEQALVDGLVAVLDDRERSNGREHVQELSVDRVAERTLGVYLSAIR
ncbi:Glycosyltransferase-like protein [Salinarchaeum sp. Harcht-Bsk1]|uniref:glycosyltransferase family 4 protein n=1 Tax=Salinarchaeum sp. Harcht-Bsk1 TaxID=1333523 RepID=UPI00034232DA|nr:glycosyltransferase family 4 protein [Salinarchaeum sp. Harcht-Bsk1]AGN00040.1 Glycosyltransferase-like protein [Salinarchaeum sp. Harcht-Bsk1]